MAGSSRSLQKALETAFQNWDSSESWESSPGPAIKELYTTIYAFNERHNSSATISNNINEILRTAHTDYINNSSDLSKEVFFVDVLSRLSPSLAAADVELWLRTYLRPALDSAGFDILYVSKTRRLLGALTTDTLPTTDASLRHRRERIAKMTMEYVMQIYIGKDSKAYDMIQLAATDADMNTQIFAERRRFIERNASGVLIEWGLQYPKEFFVLLNPHFNHPESRLKTLVLASMLVSKSVSSIQTVVETPFYVNLLRCLCLDSSESILRSALNVLMMSFGKTCHKIALHLPELLIILSRLEAWNSGLPEIRKDSKIVAGWALAGPESTPSVVKGHQFPERKFDSSYLITLIYGLFPKSLISFANDPHLFLSQNPPSILEESPDFLKNGLGQSVSKTINSCLERCLIHPNFLHNVSGESEVKNPIEWILQKNTYDEIGEAEVLFECLSLNPEILISIPDDYVLPDKLISKIRSSDHLHSIMSSRKASVRSLDSLVEHKTGLRGMSSSSINEHSMATDKRFSPSQKTSFPESPTGAFDSIEFKPFTFDGSSSTAQSTLNKSTVSLRDDLSTLFSEHEKLYTSAASVAANGTNEIERTPSNDIVTRRHSEKNEELLKTTFLTGNILDFYQRELLLIKNELEFASYLRSLYKLRYVKLKLKLNSISESISKQPESKESTTTEKTKLIDFSKNLLEEKDKKLKTKIEENEMLLNKTAQMHAKLEELEISLKDSKADAEAKSETLEKNLKGIQLKESEIINLRNELAYLSKQPKSTPEQTGKTLAREPSFTLSYNERDFVNLKTENSMLQNQKVKAESDLEYLRRTIEFIEKDFESQLSKTKLEMRTIFSERSTQYEKKIKELSGVILKYEAALQEERVRATQLSKTIPIRTTEFNQQELSPGVQYGGSNWPSSYKLNSNEGNGDYFGSGNVERVARGSHASAESSSSSSLPSTNNTPTFISKHNSYILPRQASSTTMPIVKGRGGYQKRSKKVM